MNHAAEYKRRGWTLALIPANDKAPRHRDWYNRNPSVVEAQDHLARGGNIGLILGPRSGETVDVDLDCLEAIELTPLYLHTTGAIFGRPAKPMSHWLYTAPGAAYESFGDPLAVEKATLIELRAPGRTGGAHQTLLPPSVTDDERREWHGETIAPLVIEAVALRTAVAWLAIGCLVMRYVSETAARNPGPDLPRLLWEADPALGRRACNWLGMPHPDAPRRYSRPRRKTSEGKFDLAELVAAIPNTCDWHAWNAIGLAIFAVDNSEHGLTVFDDFSAKSPKYDAYTVEERWRNYGRSPPGRTGIGKLIALAAAAGYRTRRHR